MLPGLGDERSELEEGLELKLKSLVKEEDEADGEDNAGDVEREPSRNGEEELIGEALERPGENDEEGDDTVTELPGSVRNVPGDVREGSVASAVALPRSAARRTAAGLATRNSVARAGTNATEPPDLVSDAARVGLKSATFTRTCSFTSSSG